MYKMCPVDKFQCISHDHYTVLIHIYPLIHSIKRKFVDRMQKKELEGTIMIPPIASFVLPTLDCGTKLSGGKTIYES